MQERGLSQGLPQAYRFVFYVIKYPTFIQRAIVLWGDLVIDGVIDLIIGGGQEALLSWKLCGSRMWKRS